MISPKNSNWCNFRLLQQYLPRTDTPLFNDLVGNSEQIRRDGHAESSRGLQVDHQLEFGWLLYRSAGLAPFNILST
jgi:hypothetical protein